MVLDTQLSLYYLRPMDTSANISDESLETIAKLSTSIAYARKAVNTQYPDVKMGVYQGEKESLYWVSMWGEKGEVSQAISLFAESAPLPDLVSGNYEVMKDVLDSHGKTLELKLTGWLTGKHVVDAAK